MSFKHQLLLLVLVISFQSGYAQTESDPFIETLLESIAENNQSETDYSELSERLYFIKQHPYDLNTVTPEQLTDLVFLSPLQITGFLDYRSDNGPFVEIQELQLIDLFTEETLQYMIPFIMITKPGMLEIKNSQAKSTHELMTTYSRTLEQQKGYLVPDTVSHYTGSPFKLLNRYRYHFGKNISGAVTMEKDAGEPFGSSAKPYGFDFYSASLFIRNGRYVKKLALGDYSLQFGQGLSLWSGLSFGKGANIAGIAKLQSGLKPYSSTNETEFFRGVAATIAIKHFELTPFISYHHLDASVFTADTLINQSQISSLSITGLHRTSSELDNKGAASQLAYGSVIQYNGKALRSGAILYQTRYNYNLEAGQFLYNKFEFAGSTLTNSSVYYNYTWNNLYSFAEVSHSLNSGFALISGLMGSLSSKVSAVLFYRNYQKNYYSFFNKAINEGSNASNESGFYSGLSVAFTPKTEVSFYTDFFRFPWLRYRVDVPSSGREILVQASWSPKKSTKVSFRYKSNVKEQNDAGENTINYLVPVNKDNYRLDFLTKLNSNFQFRNRVEVVQYKKASNSQIGLLAYQDVLYKPMGSKLSGNFRVAFFHCDAYDSRIYAFENDVLYSYSIPAYQDKGYRFYLNTRYRLSKSIDAWLRYSITQYSAGEDIGSGLDLIEGRHKSDIKMQVRYSLK
ncbi:helix-hairpin-helix domain-containing protein [Arcticibacter eurypsychrophilus]|uniref:helix-hairpin-helix domain-containing protein n=1 Tax=Arcticibacter eurypsychrophilus TaxID=1434752 RepID=UPI00084D63E8|nr:helix-hairpin-helix domain-containing protein [Arcticibacter eurypsychrophilus]